MIRKVFLGVLFLISLGSGIEAVQDHPGADDLDKAFDRKLSAASLRDLDEVADLCQSAIDKGLSEESKAQAIELQVATWVEYAEQMEEAIFSAQRDRRWKIFRREALQRLEKAVAAKPDSLSAQLLIARLNALEGGDRAAASRAVEKAIELAASDNEKLSRALLVRAAIAESNDARLNDLNQALKISPENLDAIRTRALVYLQTDQPDKALDDLKKWSELDDQALEPHLLMVQVLSQLDRASEGLEILDKAIGKTPDSANLLSLRARLHLDLSRGKDKPQEEEHLNRAVADATAAIQLDADEIEALIVRATILSDRKQFTEALADINHVLEVQPNLVRGLWIRSLINASSKNYQKAIEDVELLAENSPENDAFQLQLAALSNALEKPRKAIEIYDRVLRIEPEHAQALRGRGDAYLSLGEHKLAIKDYQEALEITPDDDGILNNLAWVLATSPTDDLRDGKKALELATKACELTEFKEAHILSTLASAHAEMGDFDAALKWVKEGIAKSTDPEQQENLTKELKSYEEKKPWRELQNVEEEQKSKSKPAGEGGESPVK